MTKETKIGLLVGLAFIILFAIILSEKSGGARDATFPTFALADANRKVGPVTGGEKPLHDAGRLPVESKLPPIVETLPAAARSGEGVAATGNRSSFGGDSTRPLNAESLDELLNPPSDSPGAVATRDEQGSSELRTVPLGEAVQTALEIGPPPVLPKPEGASDSAKSRSEVELAVASPAAAAAFEPVTERQPARVETAPPIKTTHEVQAGESLGKIAAKYYGRSTPKRIEAIFNANRDVLPDVNKVKASMKLQIPDLGEHNGRFEAVAGFLGSPGADDRLAKKDDNLRIPPPVGGDRARAAGPAVKAEKPRSDAPAGAKPAKGGKPDTEKAASDPPFEWYEIKPSDTLAKIAAKRLGNQRFYNEIARLNRDRISDKNVLKPGVKIRVPIKVASSAPRGDLFSSNGPDSSEP